MWSNKSVNVSTIHWDSAMASSSKQQAPKKKTVPVPSTSPAVSCSPGLQAAYRMVETLGRKILQVSSAEHKMETQKTTGSTFFQQYWNCSANTGAKRGTWIDWDIYKNKQQAPLPMPSTSSAIIQTDKAGNSRNTTKFNFWWTQCTAT